jgi:hypothetical protein
MDEFNVEIRFPRQSDPDQNVVLVSGESEDAVFDCIDELRNLEETYLQDVIDRHAYRHPEFVQDTYPVSKPQESILVTRAPWECKEEEFTAMSGNGEGPSAAATNGSYSFATTASGGPRGAWGKR